jgi:hypothetical protein
VSDSCSDEFEEDWDEDLPESWDEEDENDT